MTLLLEAGVDPEGLILPANSSLLALLADYNEVRFERYLASLDMGIRAGNVFAVRTKPGCMPLRFPPPCLLCRTVPD